MKKITVAMGVVAALLVPSAAAAKPNPDKASREDARRNAAKECKAERAEIGAQAFAATYGTNPNKRNALGKCVSRTVRAA
jgi:hypothetical protein